MAGILTSRVLAMALMMALLVKPCLGLIADWTVDRADVPASRIVAATEAGQAPAPCKRICLSGRVEEVHAIARPVKVTLAGSPATALRHREPGQFIPASASPLPKAATPDVRERLALLSRLLL